MYLAEVEQAARLQNYWDVIGAVQTHAGGNGFRPHGYAVIKRDNAAFGEGREFGTVRWYFVQEGTSPRVGFEQGHYDQTFEDALVDLSARLAVAGLRS